MTAPGIVNNSDYRIGVGESFPFDAFMSEETRQLLVVPRGKIDNLKIAELCLGKRETTHSALQDSFISTAVLAGVPSPEDFQY